MAFDNNSYQSDYKRQNYDRLNILVPRGRGKEIKKEAARRGISVSQLIIQALESYCELDLSKVNGE